MLILCFVYLCFAQLFLIVSYYIYSNNTKYLPCRYQKNTNSYRISGIRIIGRF